jgi:hypothetical protein
MITRPLFSSSLAEAEAHLSRVTVLAGYSSRVIEVILP